MLTSDFDKTNDASPLKRTEVPYISAHLRVEAGLALWARAAPQDITGNTARVWADILDWIAGIFECNVDLVTPTCSA